MFKKLSILVAVLFVALSAPAKADVKAQIAVVDIQKILKESKAAKNLRSKMEKEQKSFKSAVEKQDKKLKSAQQDLAKNRSVLSADAFERKRKSFEKDIADAQKKLQTKKGDLDKKFMKAMEKIQSTMLSITSDIAKDQGYVLVLPRGQVVMVDKTMNITDEVLKKLDSKLSKVSL